MSEIALQKKLQHVLESKDQVWREIPILNSTSGLGTMGELVGSFKFGLPRIEEPLLSHKRGPLSEDAFQGQKPDISLISETSGQLRILIEVKQATGSTHKELDASQFLRNLLYLIAATDRKPRGKPDIERAVLLAAPNLWFKNPRLSRHWDHLVKQYGALARDFHITLGEIRLDDLKKGGG